MNFLYLQITYGVITMKRKSSVYDIWFADTATDDWDLIWDGSWERYQDGMA